MGFNLLGYHEQLGRKVSAGEEMFSVGTARETGMAKPTHAPSGHCRKCTHQSKRGKHHVTEQQRHGESRNEGDTRRNQ
jgi:hypothetical protein